jgi:hypothetical protein
MPDFHGSFIGGSLGDIVQRVNACEAKNLQLSFLSGLNLIQLSAKLDILREIQQFPSIMDVIRHELEPGGQLSHTDVTETRIDHWKCLGYKLAAFAGAGMFLSAARTFLIANNRFYIWSHDLSYGRKDS